MWGKIINIITFCYEKFCSYIFGINNSDITSPNFRYVDDFLRQKIYPLRGMVDSLVSTILFFGIICFSGVLKNYLEGDVTHTIFGINIIIAPYFLFLLLLFIDDYSRVRILDADSPCRSMGRQSLNISTVIAFGIAFIFFSFGDQYRIEGCLILSIAFFCRFLWGSKAHIEAGIWERAMDDVVTDKEDDSITISQPLPKIFSSDIWSLHRQRLKQVIIYSFLYASLFFLIWFIDLLDLGFIMLLEKLSIEVLFVKIIFSTNIEISTVFSLFFLMIYLIFERFRFKQDLKALKKLKYSKDQIEAEGFAIVTKTILWMFPAYKKRLLRKVFRS